MIRRGTEVSTGSRATFAGHMQPWQMHGAAAGRSSHQGQSGRALMGKRSGAHTLSVFKARFFAFDSSFAFDLSFELTATTTFAPSRSRMPADNPEQNNTVNADAGDSWAEWAQQVLAALVGIPLRCGRAPVPANHPPTQSTAANMYGVEDHIVQSSDKLYAKIAHRLPSDPANWPQWTRPYLIDAHTRHQRKLAGFSAGARNATGRHVQGAPSSNRVSPERAPVSQKSIEGAAPVASPHKKLTRRPRMVPEVVITTRAPKRPQEDPAVVASPAKRRAVLPQDDSATVAPPKCDFCADAVNIDPVCVLREGNDRCDRCLRRKKACRHGKKNYAEWFDRKRFTRGNGRLSCSRRS